MKLEIIISIMTGILTVAGTIATVAYGWGKIKQFMEDLKENLSSFRQEIKDEIKEIKKDVKEHDRDIVF